MRPFLLPEIGINYHREEIHALEANIHAASRASQ
jgi:hypothetical protein